MRAEYGTRFALRDGVELSADVYLPDGLNPVAVVVARTPYNKNIPFCLAKARQYVQRGYGFVWVDVRGRGDSDGAFAPYRQDGRDGYDTIEWIAEQPWCTGKVITWGQSYLGAIQLLAAVEQPPHLAAMVVYVTPSDPFVDWPTGVHLPIEVSWFRLVQDRMQQTTDGIDWDAAYHHLPLITMDEAAGFRSERWKEDLSRPPADTEYWGEMSFQDRLAQVDIPALHVTGWYDDVQPGGVRNFAILSEDAPSPAARAAQRLVIGPWNHELTRNRRRVLGDIDFGEHSDFDLDGFELDWLDHYVLGADNGADREARVQYFEMGTNHWTTSPVWPPEGQELSLYLAPESRLLTDVAPDGDDIFRYDPADPYPFITGATSSQIGGPDDYRALHESRDDVLLYTSSKLSEPLGITGQVTVELWVSTDGPDTDFMAKLLDVHPDGFTQRLCDGMTRVRFRDGMTEERFVEPGEIVKLEIDLWNIGHVFLPGHAVRLEITSSAFPKYDRNLNSGEPIATGTTVRVAHNTVWHGSTRPSRLVLPWVAPTQPRETA